MKYCSKCGKELMDEAVICPSCGCSVASLSNNKYEHTNEYVKIQEYESKVNTLHTISIIAFVLFAIETAPYLFHLHDNLL